MTSILLSSPFSTHSLISITSFTSSWSIPGH